MDYIVSKDEKTGLWYAHHIKTPGIPVSGSFSDRKTEAREYAKMYNLLPNNVQQIEDRRHREFIKWLNS